MVEDASPETWRSLMELAVREHGDSDWWTGGSDITDKEA